jgi:hypothetical protein
MKVLIIMDNCSRHTTPVLDYYKDNETYKPQAAPKIKQFLGK